MATLVGTQLGQTVAVGGRDPLVLVAGLGSAALLAGVIQTPGVSQLLGCRPLGPVGWAIVLAASAAGTAASIATPLILPNANHRLPPASASRGPAGSATISPDGAPGSAW